MTIEIAPSPLQTAVAPPRDEAAPDKTRTDAGAPPPGRSFDEVLGEHDVPEPVAVRPRGRPVGGNALLGDALADARGTPALQPPGDDAVQALPDEGVLDPAQLLAQGLVVSPPAPQPPWAPQAAGAGEPGAAPGAGGGARGVRPVWLSDGSAAAPSAAGTVAHAAGNAVRGGKAAWEAANQAAQVAQATQTGSVSVAAAGVPDSASAKAEVPAPVQVWAQTLVSTLARAPEGNTLSWGEHRKASEGSEGAPRVLLSDPSSAAFTSATGQGGAMGVDGVVAAGSGAAADGHAPAQVHYWAGTEVHKAELTLDGVGAGAVEVSIAMQGNEATVAFRSDEAPTREALARASEQLQDAMARQGVVLAGVSVGTSHAGDPSRQGQGQGPKPSGWKIAGVTAATQEAPRAAHMASTGSRLDLYV
ncbi:MAG: flagellar hook-length control protein FliK [Rhodoferax sp.]|nr:flagellar hook-length control protein FliK [Rhodoferax sp.]